MGYGGLPKPKVYDHKSYFSIQNFVGILGLYMCSKNNILTISNNLTHIDSAYTILIQSNSFKKCNASDLVFLILKKNSYSVIHESFIIFFFECPGGLRSVGAHSIRINNNKEGGSEK